MPTLAQKNQTTKGEGATLPPPFPLPRRLFCTALLGAYYPFFAAAAADSPTAAAAVKSHIQLWRQRVLHRHLALQRKQDGVVSFFSVVWGCFKHTSTPQYRCFLLCGRVGVWVGRGLSLVLQWYKPLQHHCVRCDTYQWSVATLTVCAGVAVEAQPHQHPVDC